MFNFVKLNCPTCGASLSVDKNSERFACEHCGNNFVLENKASDLKTADREHLSPLTTYTHQLKQWIKVANYEICLQEVREERHDGLRVFCINVEYRNNGRETLSCRRNQWILFDCDGYTYDNDSANILFEGLPGQPLGGDRLVTPGSRVRGWVTFKLPESAVIERLQFLTGYLATKTAEFMFK